LFIVLLLARDGIKIVEELELIMGGRVGGSGMGQSVEWCLAILWF
jgi:hypothetical protein